MTGITLRPARPDDFAALAAERLPWRTRAIAAEVAGRCVGIGGLVFRPDGVWASALISDECRRYKVTILRAARRLLAEAKAAKIRRIYATAECGRRGAEAFLIRLGFKRIEGSDVFMWCLDVE